MIQCYLISREMRLNILVIKIYLESNSDFSCVEITVVKRRKGKKCCEVRCFLPEPTKMFSLRNQKKTEKESVIYLIDKNALNYLFSFFFFLFFFFFQFLLSWPTCGLSFLFFFFLFLIFIFCFFRIRCLFCFFFFFPDVSMTGICFIFLLHYLFIYLFLFNQT